MQLFDNFSVVKFPEEDMLLITKNSYVYYIYAKKDNIWKKYKNAGNDLITIINYKDVSKEEIIIAMGGRFPTKETDFIRLCRPCDLFYRDMILLFEEDYKIYMMDLDISNAVKRFLEKSNILYKSYSMIKNFFDNALKNDYDVKTVLNGILELSYKVIGKDIFNDEIEIIDGHNSSSYFWIKPVRIIDYKDTNEIDNVAEFETIEVSIEETDVDIYLSYFLYKHFDKDLEANKKRIEQQWIDENNKLQIEYIEGFEWYLTFNFYTFESIINIIDDIKDAIAALKSKKIHEFINGFDVLSKNEKQKMINFYKRLIYRLEYMMKIGQENGYDLISFMGP